MISLRVLGALCVAAYISCIYLLQRHTDAQAKAAEPRLAQPRSRPESATLRKPEAPAADAHHHIAALEARRRHQRSDVQQPQAQQLQAPLEAREVVEPRAEVAAWRALGMELDSSAAQWQAFRLARRLAADKEHGNTDALSGVREQPPASFRVLIDWPHSAFNLTEVNYAAFESFATGAVVEVTVVAPQAISWFRYSNAVSLTQFEKYRKLGVDVQIKVVNSAMTMKGPGSAWWSLNKARCPAVVDTQEFLIGDARDVVPSAAVALFLRCSRLWELGGWSTDLTVFALEPLKAARGFNVRCGSMLLAFKKQDPALECVLRLFDECRSVECSDDIARRASEVFGNCFEGVVNDLAGAVEWFGCDADQAEAAHTTAGTLMLPFLWIGPRATEGLWRPVERESIFGKATAMLPVLKLADEKCAAQVNETWCHRMAPAPAGRAMTAEDSARLNLGTCAPSLVTPATQKGASTYLFDVLASHPQLLRPLRGSAYKEAGAYMNKVYYRDTARARGSRFSGYAPTTPLMSMDASVSYATESRLPAMRLALDNPRAKAVFALREPVDRSFSDYRFNYHAFSGRAAGWGGIVLSMIRDYDACFTPKVLADDALGLEAYFGSRCTGLFQREDPFGMLRKGIYFYQVLHWRTVLGAEHVTVVTAEQLRRDAKGVATRVAKFAGLCDFDFEVPAGPIHVSAAKLKAEHVWTLEAYLAVRKWFVPLNEKLFGLLGVTESDLGWQSDASSIKAKKFRPPSSRRRLAAAPHVFTNESSS